MYLVGSTTRAYFGYGVALGLFFVVAVTLQLLFLPERNDVPLDTAPTLVPALIDSWNNTPYRRYVLLSVLSKLGPSGVSGVMCVVAGVAHVPWLWCVQVHGPVPLDVASVQLTLLRFAAAATS